jgi:hypothetical protein
MYPFFSRIHWHYLILGVCGFIFFGVYQYLHQPELLRTLFSGASFTLVANQPDEVSNYFFATELASQGIFGYREELSMISDNQVHPRSMTVVYNHLAPIGSPFIIILLFISGVLGIAFGEGWFTLFATFLIPLLAVATPFFLYGIIRRVFGLPLFAFFTALLVYLLPPWWYYGSYVFQHTIPVIFFVVLGIYGAVRIYEGVRRRTFVSFLTGASLATAVAIRPFDVIWIMSVVGLLAYFWFRRRKMHELGYAFFGGVVVLVALLFVHYGYYGHPFGTGYIIPRSDGGAGIITSGTRDISFLSVFFAPFGFDFAQIVRIVYGYLIRLFLPWSILASIGMVFVYIHRTKMRVLWRYTIAFLGVSMYLLFYYGSWNSVSDAFTSVATIGSGHVRYFMPIYVGALPLIGYVLYLFYSLLIRYSRQAALIFCVSFFGAFGLYSFRSVFLSSPNGLVYVKETLAFYYHERKLLVESVPEEGIVVTRYADKYIFPLRKVIIRGEDGAWVGALAKLNLQQIPLYWYDVELSPEELEGVARLLDPYGLELGLVIYREKNNELRSVGLKK